MTELLRFIGVEVENIFAYEGSSRIDLTGCSDEQNIIVVSGRNGAGKTSLLNAMKLLFLGSEDEEIRRVGWGGVALSPKHYVLGQPGRWFGVFNSSTRMPGSRARVALEWREGDRVFKAERSFKQVGGPGGFEEELTLTVDSIKLPVSEASARIAALASKEVVPFFFFDGEQVQSFADAEEGRERAEIERLLGLSFVPELTREIDNFAKAKRRAGMPSDVRVAIVSAENAHRDATARGEAASRSRVEVEEEIIDIQRQLRKLDDERNGLRTGISETDRRRMVSRIDVLNGQHERLSGEIAEQLPPEAPWLTNLGIVREVFDKLNRQLAGSADATLAGRLHRELPDDLIARLDIQQPPITLTEPQKHAFGNQVRDALEAKGVPANSYADPLLLSLSPRQAKSLRDRFLVWSESGPGQATSQAEKLRQIRQLTAERIQAQRDLDEAELTTDEARHRFERLTSQLSELELTLRERTDKAAEHKVAEQRAQREASDALDSIRRHEAKYESVTRDNQAYLTSLKAKRALEDYRDLRRAQIRGSVEKRLNERISILLGPSQLIKAVTLDVHFAMRYFDERGDEVARRSISAGMRQLVAMAMLWALRDEARRDLPVMIDTPLGRIDRENRALLMSEYFPNAGNPLVLLPTNSEISSDGFDQLGARVRRRYEIQNTGGKSARIVELSGGVREMA